MDAPGGSSHGPTQLSAKLTGGRREVRRKGKAGYGGGEERRACQGKMRCLFDTGRMSTRQQLCHDASLHIVCDLWVSADLPFSRRESGRESRHAVARPHE